MIGAPVRGRLAVVAVGGNALTAEHELGTADEILTNAAAMGTCIGELVRGGARVAVVHGNGPQVGNLALQQDAGADLVPGVPPQPLHQLCAMTQGQLGSVLVREIDRVCGAGKAVAVVTHVTVRPTDPAFESPSKPIGPFFDAEHGARVTEERGWQVVEDSGRGYRRVVPSPEPTGIVELNAIGRLLDAEFVVLAAGGGGVAVREDREGANGMALTGVDAVIDKDHAAVALGTAVGASELYLLTGVDAVMLDFGTATERPAHHLTVEAAQRYLDEGQFPAGSMGPKVTAALRFLRDGGRRVVITSARQLTAAAAGEPTAGTRIEPADESMTVAR